jgi:hypothetical protein
MDGASIAGPLDKTVATMITVCLLFQVLQVEMLFLKDGLVGRLNGGMQLLERLGLVFLYGRISIPFGGYDFALDTIGIRHGGPISGSFLKGQVVPMKGFVNGNGIIAELHLLHGGVCSVFDRFDMSTELNLLVVGAGSHGS